MVDREIIYDGQTVAGQREIEYPLKTSGGGGITYEHRHDFVDPMDYIGKAVTGSLDYDSVWTITRNEYFLGGAVITKTATNVKWTDRLTAIYI